MPIKIDFEVFFLVFIFSIELLFENLQINTKDESKQGEDKRWPLLQGHNFLSKLLKHIKKE